MKKQIYSTAALLMLSLAGNEAIAQSKIKDNTVTGSSSLPRAGSILELESNNKGAMMPRISLSATTTWGLLGTDSAGMIVYNNNPAMTGTTAAPILSGGIGFYYWDGDRWVGMSAGSGTGDFWRLKGNAGTTPPTTVGTAVGSNNYWGTSDAQNLAVGTNGTTRAIYDQSGNYFGGNGSIARGGAQNSIAWGTNNIDSASNSIVAGSGNVLHSAAGGNAMVVGINHNLGGNLDQSVVLGSGNVMMGGGGPRSVLGGITDTLVNSFNTIVSGTNNKLENSNHSILVGDANKGYGAAVSAVFGTANKDSATYTLVAGGLNVLTPISAYTVIGGVQNSVTNTGGNPSGADANAVFGFSNTINSGVNNNIEASKYTHANLVVGHDNVNTTSANSLISGNNNTLTEAGTTVMGGRNNNVYRALGPAVFGHNNKDSANYTFVAGRNNIVHTNGDFASAIGFGNDVSGTGNGAWALGYQNNANGNRAMAFGTRAKATGDFSVALGYQDSATTDFAVSIGTDNKSKGAYSLTLGDNNTSSGNYAIGIGTQNTVAAPFSSDGAYAFGALNQATGRGATAIGYSNIASGAKSVAIGANNTAAFDNSMALGASATTTKSNQLILGFTGGVVMSALPSYATDAAADADATLPSGSLYKLSGSRAVYQKP